jgi:hypothetical protein
MLNELLCLFGCLIIRGLSITLMPSTDAAIDNREQMC